MYKCNVTQGRHETEKPWTVRRPHAAMDHPVPVRRVLASVGGAGGDTEFVR